jgi:16S rRNA (guanine1207-N2)-methyltransferase
MSVMQQAIVNTLFRGLEELVPPLPEKPQVAFLRAMHSYDLAAYPHATQWHYEQSFAPYADMLREGGYAVTPDIAHMDGQDVVLFAATRFAEENLATLARGWRMLRVGGWMVVAQHNDLGAKRLDGVVRQLGERHSLSKHHCRAIAVQKTGEEPEVVAAWLKQDAPQTVEGAPLQAAPGMFSWRKVDAGSRLLIEALPPTLAGKGADICAGWGYLSWALLESRPAIAHITLIEAEKRALDMAGRNLAAHAEKCRFLWADATRPLGVQGLDWAVMNPPAHDMLQSAPEASAAIFASAASALKQGGTLYLVANRHLPYERHLEELFGEQVTTHEQDGFKVIEAVKCR